MNATKPRRSGARSVCGQRLTYRSSALTTISVSVRPSACAFSSAAAHRSSGMRIAFGRVSGTLAEASSERTMEPSTLQELKMLGNGVVPQQAELALRMLAVTS